MKSLKFIFLVNLLSLNAFAYYEDNPRVQELVDSGDLEVTYKSEKCPRSYYKNQKIRHELGAGEETVCVNHVRLPGDVLAEVMQMEDIQLQNESDYDRRVTKLYVFEQEKFDPGFMYPQQLETLAEVLNIPASHTKDFRFGAFLGTEDSFDSFKGLNLTDYQEESTLHRYLAETLKGQLVQEIIFQDFEALYPGGGFGVRHHIYITETHLVYVKYAYWDA